MRKVFVNPSPICAFICEICGRKLSAIFFPADPADSADSSQINFVEWSIDIPFRRNLCGFSAPSAKICGKYFKHYLFPAEDTDNAE